MCGIKKKLELSKESSYTVLMIKNNTNNTDIDELFEGCDMEPRTESERNEFQHIEDMVRCGVWRPGSGIKA